MWVRPVDWEDPLEEAILLQYSCLENSLTEEPGGLQSTGSQGAGHDWNDLTHTHRHYFTYFIASNSVITKYEIFTEIFGPTLLKTAASKWKTWGWSYASWVETVPWFSSVLPKLDPTAGIRNSKGRQLAPVILKMHILIKCQQVFHN